MLQTHGAHNAIYRGENITNLFYDGTLSQQIAAGTFDDIFIGDYITGQTSGRKYLVADINYRLHTGDTECTTPHVLMIPEQTMESAQMNTTNTTAGAYIGSKMYTANLASVKSIIKNDFGTNHILEHRNYLQNTITNDCESDAAWYNSDIELMNEAMVYGSNIYKNYKGEISIPGHYGIDTSQLALFRYRHDLIVALNDFGGRDSYYLRDMCSSKFATYVNSNGTASYGGASSSRGIRPAFLIY